MKASEFVGLLFLARDVAHSAHLNTRSYAKHMALDTFYSDVIDLADKFAEAYQGKNGLIGGIALQSSKASANTTEFLQAQVAEIIKVRYEVVEKDCTTLQNIIDEILDLYYSTIYKLRFLA